VWDPDAGPSSVTAGECDRCTRRPRCLPTCGPTAWTALCPTCAEEVGDDAWCDGHLDEGRRLRAWAQALPPEWATVTRLWWIATGEVRADPSWIDVARAEVADPVRALLR
jgi:hypothetical protein